MIALASIAHNEPRVIAEQIRLLGKHLEDDYTLTVVDTSANEAAAREVQAICQDAERCGYWRGSERLHHEGLNRAAQIFAGSAPGYPLANHYFGFLDHDVFPTKPTTLIDKIEEAGFYGVGQRHPASGHLYLWPGFCFFSREWLAGRELDFSGIRGKHPRDDGDTGSGLWPLFEGVDWEKMYRVEHGYRPIREPDSCGLQSWGIELLGDWIHLTNASKWMAVPDPEERDRIVFEMLAAL